MSERSDTWMPFYVGDYLSATGRLTTEQHGAYLLILLDYWKNGPLPNDDAVLAALARLSLSAWRRAKPALMGFFDIRDGTLIQKRVERERERAANITDERSKAGKAGAAKRWQTDKQNSGKRIANAIDLPMANCQQNDAPSQSQVEEKVPLANANGDIGPPSDPAKSLFDEGVKLLVSRGRPEPQARSIIAKFQRDFGDPAVLDAINRCRTATDPVSAMRDRLGKTKSQSEYLGV